MDSNSYSTTWGSKDTNPEGETVENFVAQHDLRLLNQGNQLTTFCSSNINITLAKGAVAGWVQNWCVRDGLTLSDHRVITFTSSTAAQPRLPILDIQPRYKTKLRNYQKFESNLKLNLRDLPASINTKAEIEQYSLLLENAIINTAKTTLGLTKLRAKTVPWWTPHLTNLRNKTIKARRSFQRCHGSNRDQKWQMYLDQKTEYVRTLRHTKRGSWRKFVQ